MPKANRGVEVLGTLALVAPSLADFQHVKVRVEGEVARLTLDRSDHNLLNERMLSELATGISALEIGLVNWLVPESELQAKVNEVIAKVTAQSGPVLSMAKKAIMASLGLPLRDGVRNSMKVFLNELGDLEDSQEGVRALVEKRAPKWKNR